MPSPQSEQLGHFRHRYFGNDWERRNVNDYLPLFPAWLGRSSSFSVGRSEPEERLGHIGWERQGWPSGVLIGTLPSIRCI
jgi:hypothetical protein